MTTKRKPRTPPGKAHAARVARGRVPVSVVLSPAGVALLRALSARRGETQSAVIEAALAALANA